MTYSIDPRIHEQNYYRCHSPERHYVGQLEEQGMLVRLDNVAIDARQLFQRAFVCDSRWCLRCKEEGSLKKYKGSCCTDLEVDLTDSEIERLRELGAIARKKLDLPARDPLTPIIQRLTEGTFIEVTEKGDTALKHMPNGRCMLGWITREGAIHCGINGLCRALDLPLGHYKPDPCFLYPLHYAEYAPGQFLLTLICEETHQWVGADPYTARLRCLRKPMPGAPPAYVSLRDEIILCFGQAFYEALAKAAQPFIAGHGGEAAAS